MLDCCGIQNFNSDKANSEHFSISLTGSLISVIFVYQLLQFNGYASKPTSPLEQKEEKTFIATFVPKTLYFYVLS